MADNWTDRIVGDRMTVDREFNDRVVQSQFSRQQWGLIMTAVEFEIEHPGDESRARIVADTSNLSAIMPELKRVDEMSGMGAQAGQSGGSSGGVLDNLKSALGLGGNESRRFTEEDVRAAEQLVQAYADELQAHLEERGKWAEVRASVAEDQ